MRNRGSGTSSNADASVDQRIMATALPAMMNLAIIPVVSSVEAMWIGRMGDAAMIGAQSAASTAYLTVFYLLGFVPTMAAPVVAALLGGNKKDEARKSIGETLGLCVILGALATVYVCCIDPAAVLRLAMGGGGEAKTAVAVHALSYLRWKAACLVPMLVNAASFAAFRGALDTRTPMKVTLASGVVKLALDPLLIVACNMGMVGAPMASLVAETLAAIVNVALLVRRGLLPLKLRIRTLLPTWNTTLKPLLTGGTAMILRQLAINVCTLAMSRRAQAIGAGVEAAAYGIAMNIYTIGFVVHVALQGAAAALIPSEYARRGKADARKMADRLFQWSVVTGICLGVLQQLALPLLLPLFTTLPEVREAVKAPALVASLLHVVNGPRFVAEGEMIGLRSFRDLTAITVVGTSLLVACLQYTSLGQTLQGVMLANLVFCSYQTIALVSHYWAVGELRRSKKGEEKKQEKEE
mmetsp:Transcript_16664/g.30254  ORF Transcript_16664/g.30254 Transcript_16664/m.30254 type:complete len:468 (-) Transcript_16664:140-1543(-)|eukprot:CAMPEP_0202005690 /NCGR_PEP_ID=MMETSP0905-20130828/10667_1 /ASSEMBLY_ACC=CAM_ASM_000554 /TAXON_ID=420261 /ORGANISM="Thalassiosira antarctica, Strain CCMP982" /LENGTH=467 /DNA_ID=CAMNT_0048563303 /DNA_START=271 /DNA_END=1674 /DNA_ORIENTATION=+